MQEVGNAIRARHGIDPMGSGTLRARFEQALAELPYPGPASGGSRLSEPTSDERARASWLDAIATRLRVGETRFHRDGAQLEALARKVLEPALAAGRCRVLSAGCSTGEEAFTLAMMLADLAPRGAEWDVVGLDVRAQSIEYARRGKYPVSSATSLPARLRKYAIDRGDTVEIAPAVARRVRFNLGDLLSSPIVGPYDAIVCRNVLIYFEEEPASRVVARLGRALSRDGALLVARAEVPIVRRVQGFSPFEAADVVLFRAESAKLAASAPRQPVAAPARPEVDPAPPSRVRLLVRSTDRGAEVAMRGQAMLARGAGVIEVVVLGTWDAARRAELGPSLRRLSAAARALGGRLQAGDEATARVLADVLG